MFLMETQVIDKLLLNFKSFATFFALVPLEVKVGPLMILESQKVVVAFLAHQTAEDTGLVRLLVVEE